LHPGLRSTLCCCALLAAAPPVAPPPAGKPVKTVYLDGRAIRFEAQPASLVNRGFEIGPWRFGRRIRDPKPRDNRLNLYIVAPGTQYETGGSSGFGFNCVINALSKPGFEPEWDVYWAVVLDPALQAKDIRDEKDLIRGTEAEFSPEAECLPAACCVRAPKRSPKPTVSAFRSGRSGRRWKLPLRAV
jgi:hypothetical protein